MIHTDSLRVPQAAGAEVTASLFIPSTARAAIVCLPALGVPAVYYEPFGHALADKGQHR